MKYSSIQGEIDCLTIAISKGSVANEFYKLLDKVGLSNSIEKDSRKLLFEDVENKLTFIYVKSSDVVTYVENGIADLGIVGKDMILESPKDVYELCDLKFGRCIFAVAGIKGKNLPNDKILRVATKYTGIAEKYFKEKGQIVKLIKLNGSVELAPLVGLSDVIVDLVQTGNTMKANGLEIIEKMFDISSRIICNRVSYRFKYNEINELIKLIDGGVAVD